jgi:hypothetical protein
MLPRNGARARLARIAFRSDGALIDVVMEFTAEIGD